MLENIHSHIPNQDIFFKPYTQRFHSYFDHQDNEHNYYITPKFGKYSRIVGQNTILEGFEITNLSNTETSVNIQLSKGRLIINDTYIEVYTDNENTFDQLNMFDDDGFIVLSASFINEHTLRKNGLRYHLTYFDKNHNSYGLFNHDKDKIIFGVFDFNKDESNNVTGITQREIEYITLDGIEYKVRNTEKTTTSLSIDGGTLGICSNEDIRQVNFDSVS